MTALAALPARRCEPLPAVRRRRASPSRAGQGRPGVLAVQVVVLAKAPVPGRVKTRLTPPYRPVDAAGLAAAALADTLAAVAVTPLARRLLVLAGGPRPPLPPGVEVLHQRGRGLDERIVAAIADASSGGPAPVLLVGMDTPQLTAAMLRRAAGLLLAPGVDAVLGPATDGGFWALGVARPADAGAVLGVPMSTADTGALVHGRLLARGLAVRLLPALTDVDDAATAAEVAAAAPGTRFAALVDALAHAGAA